MRSYRQAAQLYGNVYQDKVDVTNAIAEGIQRVNAIKEKYAQAMNAAQFVFSTAYSAYGAYQNSAYAAAQNVKEQIAERLSDSNLTTAEKTSLDKLNSQLEGDTGLWAGIKSVITGEYNGYTKDQLMTLEQFTRQVYGDPFSWFTNLFNAGKVESNTVEKNTYYHK